MTCSSLYRVLCGGPRKGNSCSRSVWGPHLSHVSLPLNTVRNTSFESSVGVRPFPGYAACLGSYGRTSGNRLLAAASAPAGVYPPDCSSTCANIGTNRSSCAGSPSRYASLWALARNGVWVGRAPRSACTQPPSTCTRDRCHRFRRTPSPCR